MQPWKELKIASAFIHDGLDELADKVKYIRSLKGFWIDNFKSVSEEEIKKLEKIRPTTRILCLHTMNGCNLSCKGCNHNSSLLSTKSVVDIDELLVDVRRILPQIYVWSHVSIIGGEPLLEPRTKEVTKEVRELVASTGQSCYVKLFSNGSRLMQCKDWIIDEMEQGVIFRLTFHRTWYSKIGRKEWENAYDFIKECEERGVIDKLEMTEAARYPNGDRREWFDLFRYEITKDRVTYYPWEDGKPEESFKICSCPNAQLYKGKLWKCSMIAYLYESLAATDQLGDECWQKYLEYKPPEDIRQALEEVDKPHDICNMCPANPKWYHANKQLDPALKKTV